MEYIIDFETNTGEENCCVWGVGICHFTDKGPVHSEYGTSIAWALSKMEQYGGTWYFHNLKFDGQFIISYLLQNGYWYTTGKKVGEKRFTTLISDKGQWYTIKIGFAKTKVEIRDSLKILPMSVREIAKAFHLEEGKGELDYTTEREEGHVLTALEVDYIRRDIEIVAHAVAALHRQGMKKLTTGSNAMAEYVRLIGKKHFEALFPILEYEGDIRRAYKGGYTYCNPRYQGMDVGEGIVLDVNSLYPYVMRYSLLPYGQGKVFSGRYKEDSDYPLYVQNLIVTCKLKEDHLPTLQLKNNPRFAPNAYLSEINEPTELYLTSVDLSLLLDHYDVEIHEWKGGWKFMGSKSLFSAYVDKWTEIKVQATKDGNNGLRTIAKLMLNALYGKFGLNPKVRSKYPQLGSDGVVKFVYGPTEFRKPIYIPVAVFITAWARNLTIRSAQKCGDRFLYADTDSLHLIGVEYPEGLEIDSAKLGAWKHELTFEKARFVRQKAYLEMEYVREEDVNGPGHSYEVYGRGFLKKHITCAGLPDICYPQITWENFRLGAKYSGKLLQTAVKNGVILKETTFELKESVLK